MLLKLIIFVVFVSISFGLYYFLTDTKPIFSQPVPSPAAQNLSVTYTGTLPCADCPGIKTEITLSKSNIATNSGNYIEKDIYQNRNNNQPTTTVGKWITIKGSATDANALVYVLNPNKGESIYYLVINQDTIKQLDSNKKEIDAPFNLNLTRQYN